MDTNEKTTSSSSQENLPDQAAPPVIPENVTARTKFFCMGENEGELSFKPDETVTNVMKSSLRPGWLTGTINGKTGLIPENYVEYLPHQ